MEVLVEQTYTSIACNRAPETVDWNSAGLLCFGACNAVAIYDTNVKGKDPHTILSHHTARVNGVKWIRRPDGSATELVSCSADKTAAVWSFVEGQWRITKTLRGHNKAITSVYGLYTEDDVLVVTGSVDSTIRVWERINGEFGECQVINLKFGLCLSLHAYLLPLIKKPVLFVALDDHKIHIFVKDFEYEKVHTLSGHEDWVRGLDCLTVDSRTMLLASSSQDTYIRLWRIQKHEKEQHTVKTAIKAEEKLFKAYEVMWSVKLDAVLAGHEGWVYGVQWHPYKIDADTKEKQPVFRLLSSSLDKTLIIWEPDGAPSHGEGDGAWVEKVRVGEVGGNGLGFYGSRFGPDGQSILAYGYNGSFHMWSLNKVSLQWEPQVVPGGHFGTVEDVRWEPRGRYLASASADQTTRIHAPWKRDDGLGTEWHELARPQVHGYDMTSLALVSGSVLASASEEKLVRVFRAPQNFFTNYERIVGEEFDEPFLESGPKGASVPSLGLSNKAVFSEDSQANDDDDDNDGYFIAEQLTQPPTEEHLMANSLWAESHKLYAHGHPLQCVAAAPDRSLLATACRAAAVEHCQVVLWDTTTWQVVQWLPFHKLTVTQIEFSPDSQKLLSVSRDRKWAVFQRREGSNLFDVAAYTESFNGIHTRIIWSCSWAHDGESFATASRDGKICVWAQTSEEYRINTTLTSLGMYKLSLAPLELAEPVTAVTFAPLVINNARFIVAGLESGVIMIYLLKDGWSMMKKLDNSAAHHLWVKRLQFKPNPTNDKEVTLASCGCDHMVRLYTLRFTYNTGEDLHDKMSSVVVN